MLQLLTWFAFIGMQLTFRTGVYGPCMGRTSSFDDLTPKSINSLHGVLIGVGEIAGGIIFSFLGQRANRDRDLIRIYVDSNMYKD